MHNLNSIPKKSNWFEVEFRRGIGTYLDREQWCRENCAQRWLPNGQGPGGNGWLFESHEDAVKFWWRWG